MRGKGRDRQVAPRGEAPVRVVQEGGALRIRAGRRGPYVHSTDKYPFVFGFSPGIFRPKKISGASAEILCPRLDVRDPDATREEVKVCLPGKHLWAYGPKSASKAQFLEFYRDDVGQATLEASRTT